MNIAIKNRISVRAIAAAAVILFTFASAAHANVRVRPTAITFGAVTFGVGQAWRGIMPRTVIVTNENRHNITISSATTSISQFSFSGPSLPITLGPGRSLIGIVRFHPTSTQTYSGRLVFEQANGTEFSVVLSGTGGVVTPPPPPPPPPPPTVVSPAISAQPASVSIVAGKTATFNVAATGTSPITYQWHKNGAMLSGATSSTYTTPAETTADNNAQFTVAVSNSAGTATSNPAMLTVTTPVVAPSITTQPASQTIVAGKTASFSVTASGTSPMTYQWSKNGAAISGATSATYITPAETTTDNNAKFTVA